MKSEQEKYLEALQKGIEFKKAFDELKPENRPQLVYDLLKATTTQEVLQMIQNIMQNGTMY